jgi:hypothetical protein
MNLGMHGSPARAGLGLVRRAEDRAGVGRDEPGHVLTANGGVHDVVVVLYGCKPL